MKMKFLTLNLIKSHLRIDEDFEDDLLVFYGSSAESAALRFMRRDMDSLMEEFGCVPPEIVQACLCRVGTSVKYREEVTDRTLYRLPYAWEALLTPYIPPSEL